MITTKLSRIKTKVAWVKKIKQTYSLIQTLAKINGHNVSKTILERTLFNTETLPPLGKEYWWFLFFDQNRSRERPRQIMLMIFRKHGKGMLFNNKKVTFEKFWENKFRAITTGWIYDGKGIHNLGDTNTVTTVNSARNVIASTISGQKIMLSGSFPNYRLKVGNIIDLDISEGNCVMNKDAYGVFIPPFGTGLVNAFLAAKGIVLGKNFKGQAHLQKVVGIMPFGPFHWARVVFQNGSSTSVFCLKSGKTSKKFFHRAINFYDRQTGKVIKFKNPELAILKDGKKNPLWVIKGKDHNKRFKMVLETYAAKQFTMKGGGSQVYIEYAVVPKEFILKTRDNVITLDKLGRGVGTFEDAYGSPV